MNITIWSGVALAVLGVSGVFATAAPTAAIPVLFGLVLILLGVLMRNPARAAAATWAAGGVGLLGLIASLANIASRLAAGGFRMNAAAFANITMAVICGLFLALLAWEITQARQGGRRGG